MQVARLRVSGDVDGTVGRDWIAVGIGIGITQIRIDPIHEQIAHRVFHVLGLVVDFVPGQVERPNEEQLNQPMAPHHAQGQRIASRRQARPVMRRVFRQVAFAQGFQHARDRARRYRQGSGQLPGGRGLATLLGADLVNCFDVVFHR